MPTYTLHRLTLAAFFCSMASASHTQDLSADFRSDRGLTQNVQSQLNNLGFNAGAADGLWGRRTEGAIDAFFNQYANPGEQNSVQTLLALMQEVEESWFGNPFYDQTQLITPPNTLNTRRIFTSDIRGSNYDCPECTGVVSMVLGAGDFDNDNIDEVIVGQHIIDLANNGLAVEQNSRLLILDLSDQPGVVTELEFANGPHNLAGVHEREAVIADFNGDGIDDFFIADHGLDRDPFPGAQNMLVLSSPIGPIDVTATNIPQIDDMSHGADGGDIDNDGDIDIVVSTHRSSNQYEPYVLLNNGQGVFEKRELADYITNPSLIHLYRNRAYNQYSSLRLIDLNNDDAPELLLLRCDQQQNNANTVSHILWNEGNGTFNGGTPTDLPTNRWDYYTFTNDADGIDLDGNGLVDLILTQSTRDGMWQGHFLQILMQTDPGVFVDQTASRMWNQGYRTPQNNIPFADETEVMDLDGDGDFDLVTRSLSPAMRSQNLDDAIAQIAINVGNGVFRPLDPRWVSGGRDYNFRGPIAGNFGPLGEPAVISHDLHGRYNQQPHQTWGANFYLHTLR